VALCQVTEQNKTNALIGGKIREKTNGNLVRRVRQIGYFGFEVVNH
jgi:hypothetical protein